MAVTQDNNLYNYEHYELIRELPILQIESQLVSSALEASNCHGAKVLDLGGAYGIHARQALSYGASHVDVVDINPGMIEAGAEIEKREGRHGVINYYIADCGEPLDHLGVEKGSYDILIANWLFIHTETVEALKGMWKNISEYLKPGGRVLGVRINDPDSSHSRTGKYGVTHLNIVPIPGGLKWDAEVYTEPVQVVPSASMLQSIHKSTEFDEKYGFEDIKFDDGEECEVVKKNPDFWAEWFQGSHITMVTAVRK